MLELGNKLLTIEDIVGLATGELKLSLSSDSEWLAKLESSCNYLEDLWKRGEPIYGVTTGYGRSCDVSIPDDLVSQLPLQLARFHGCGLGKVLSPLQARAVVATRAASFCRGLSGVRVELLQRLCDFVNLDLVPVIPSEGSVGASGDLTPLSYLAALVVGEREAFFKGATMSSSEALKRAGLSPLELLPKEGLAIMNGTSVMTALASIAYAQAEKLLDNAIMASSMAAVALGAPRRHFDPRFFQAKPHKGQLYVAVRMYDSMSLAQEVGYQYTGATQARYSVRCAPHVLGVLADALSWIREYIEIEINSANDNPLIDGEEEVVFHGGHFYGGHIAFAMDSLKNAIANVADLLDRQLELLVDPHTNNGLPRNLSGAPEREAAVNHGFKAVQIGTSAWAAEALKNTIPASVFSRSTESHNQDKVSMGTISARDCLRNIELTEQVLASSLLGATQALDLRVKAGELSLDGLSAELQGVYNKIRDKAEFLERDVALDTQLTNIINSFQLAESSA